MFGGVIVYKKIAELLDKTNKTAYMVAKESGISQTAFSNWKSGRTKPDINSLKILSDYFGVPIEYFLKEV